MKIVFWQSMVTRHQSALVRALGEMPDVEVTYIAAEQVDERRTSMGWTAPGLGKATLLIAPDEHAIQKLAASFDWDAVHLCQGFRGNGMIETALPALASRGARIGVMMEAIDQRGPLGFLKTPVYWRRIRQVGRNVQFCLAIGRDAAGFAARCGYPEKQIYPFTYFLPVPPPVAREDWDGFRFIFVGQLVQLKRLDLVIDALQHVDARLTVVGDGPLRAEMEARAGELLGPGKVDWLGTLPPEDTQKHIQNSDCLILPSEYDGWGAVVSEALLAGTPAICSDACGAAETVEASGAGGVFAAKDALSLSELMKAEVSKGPIDASGRDELASWAGGALAGKAGADYLLKVIHSVFERTTAPTAPWQIPKSANSP